MKKGDKIESDRVLASKLSVGRSAIREALKVLEVRNLLEVRAAYLAAGCMAAENMTISNLMRHVLESRSFLLNTRYSGLYKRFP